MAGGESGQEDETLPQHDSFLKERFKKSNEKVVDKLRIIWYDNEVVRVTNDSKKDEKSC